MELVKLFSELTDIELMTLQLEQQSIWEISQKNLQNIGAEIAKRVKAHKLKEVKPE